MSIPSGLTLIGLLFLPLSTAPLCGQASAPAKAFHYRDAATPVTYEAIVLIRCDCATTQYICHWADSTRADYSADGFASVDEAVNVLEFKFKFQDGGELTNRFAFDPPSGTWSSTIRQAEQGEWKLFCEDKFSPAAAK